MTHYRTGRDNHRTIYVQVGDKPHKGVDYQVGTMDTPELGDLVVALLNGDGQAMVENDRNARAYGWEIGRGQPIGQEIGTSDDNPFLESDWRERAGVAPVSPPLPPSSGCVDCPGPEVTHQHMAVREDLRPASERLAPVGGQFDDACARVGLHNHDGTWLNHDRANDLPEPS